MKSLRTIIPAILLISAGASSQYCPVQTHVSYDLMNTVLRTNGHVISNIFSDHAIKAETVTELAPGEDIEDIIFSIEPQSSGWLPKQYSVDVSYNDEESFKISFQQAKVKGQVWSFG
jgi:hypothetical protein